jgi:hypothetical protein
LSIDDPSPSGAPTPDANNPSGYPPTDDEKGPPGLDSSADAGASRALSWLMSQSPFTDLHRSAGDPEKHRLRGRICFSSDYVFRLVVIALLLGIITAVVVKMLAPFPGISMPG